MAATAPATLLTASALIVAAMMVGCGGDASGPPPEQHATTAALVIAETLGSADAESELERREQTPQASTQFPGFGFRTRTERLMAIDAMRRRAFDERFQEDSVQRRGDALPLRTPPLRVLQWVTTDRAPTLDTRAQRERFYHLTERAQAQRLIPQLEHKLYARVDQDRFYAMPKSTRATAVQAFYRTAEKLFAQHGIRDFVLVVTPLTETLQQLPASPSAATAPPHSPRWAARAPAPASKDPRDARRRPPAPRTRIPDRERGEAKRLLHSVMMSTITPSAPHLCRRSSNHSRPHRDQELPLTELPRFCSDARPTRSCSDTACGCR